MKLSDLQLLLFLALGLGAVAVWAVLLIEPQLFNWLVSGMPGLKH